MKQMKDPETLFERPIEEYTDAITGEVMPPWNRWLLYVEACKAKRELPLSYSMWAKANGWIVEPDHDDVVFV